MKKIFSRISILFFLLVPLSNSLFSQALTFNSTLLKVKESGTTQKVRVIVSSVEKVNPLTVNIIDNGEGSATLGSDYSIFTAFAPPGTFTLNAANAFTQVVIIDILSDADTDEDTEDIKLHFQFRNLNTGNLADSVVTIQISDDAKAEKAEKAKADKKEKDEKDHKFLGLPGIIDTTNHNKTEFSQYTDFLAFGNDKPNGLIQQEFFWKWALVKREFRVNKNVSIQPFRSILLPSILFNRIEKGKDSGSLFYPVGYTIKSITEDANGVKDTTLSPVMSTFDIMRYSSLRLEGKLVLLAIRINNARVYIDFQGSLIRNKITDTIINKNSSRYVYSIGTGFSIYVKSPVTINKDSSFNIEAQFGYNKISLLDNYFKQYDVYTIDNEGKKNIAFPVGQKYNRTSNPIFFTSIRLSKEWGKESKNSIFLRFLYSFQKGNYSFYTKENPRIYNQNFYNHYLQIHLGVNISIDKLFSN